MTPSPDPTPTSDRLGTCAALAHLNAPTHHAKGPRCIDWTPEPSPGTEKEKEMDDFYEDDEPVADVEAAFAHGYKGVTSPNFGQMVGPTENFGNVAEGLDDLFCGAGGADVTMTPTPSPTPLTDEELDNYACSHCDAPKGVECDANCVSHRLRKAEVTAIRYRMALEEITRLDGNQVGPNIARAALARYQTGDLT